MTRPVLSHCSLWIAIAALLPASIWAATAGPGAEACKTERAACFATCSGPEAPLCLSKCNAAAKRCFFDALQSDGGGRGMLQRAQRNADGPGAMAPNRPAPTLRPEAQQMLNDQIRGGGEEIPPGPHEGPPRFLPVLNIRRLSETANWSFTGETSTINAYYQRSSGGAKPSEERTLGVQIKGYQVVRCVYGDSRGRGLPHAMGFWLGQKPQLSGEALEALRKSTPAPSMIDAAVAQCPPTIGEAMTQTLGPDWQQAYAEQSHRLEAAQSPVRQEGGPWGLGPRPEAWKFYGDPSTRTQPLTAAEMTGDLDLALALQADDPQIGVTMLRALSRIESEYDTLATKHVAAAIDRDIAPHLNALLAAARVNYPGARSATIKLSFGEWEDRYLRPVMRSCAKIQAIADAYERSGAAAVGRQVMLSMQKQAYPSRVDWARLVGDYRKPCQGSMHLAFRLFQTRVESEPAIDLKYLDRLQVAGKVTRPNWFPNQDEDSRRQRRQVETRRIFYGTPGQVAAAVVTSGVATGAANTAGSIATALQQRERSISAQQGVWQSFWRCYASRCADAAQAYINYMDLLNQRDKLRFHPSAQSARAVLAMGANLLSTRYDAGIDDTKFAVEHVCEQEATELRQAARMRATGNHVDDALKLWDELAVLPVYARWTACRDSVEYLMRP